MSELKIEEIDHDNIEIEVPEIEVPEIVVKPKKEMKEKRAKKVKEVKTEVKLTLTDKELVTRALIGTKYDIKDPAVYHAVLKQEKAKLK